MRTDKRQDNYYVCGYTHADVTAWMSKNKLIAWMQESGLESEKMGVGLFETLLSEAFAEHKKTGAPISFELVGQRWRQEMKNTNVLYAYLPSQRLKDALRSYGILPTRHNCAVVNELKALPGFDGNIEHAIEGLREAGRFDLHWEPVDDNDYIWCMPTEKPDRFVFAACVTTKNKWFVPHVSVVDLEELEVDHLNVEAERLLDDLPAMNRELAEIAFEDELAELKEEVDMTVTFESKRDAMDWIDLASEDYTWRVLSPEAAERLAERESDERPFVR